MRRMSRYYLYFSIGLALAWLMAIGCAAGSPADAPTATPNVSAGTVEPANPAKAQPTASPQPGGPGPVESPDRAARAATPTPVPPTSTPAPTADASGDHNPLADAALGYLSDLAEDLGPRASATEQELEAAEYLLARFTELGYSTTLQEFEKQSQVAALTVGVPAGSAEEEIQTIPITGSAPGEVSGALEFVGLARTADISSGGLYGRIALIERGEITFQSKVDRVSRAGAVAAVVFNNRPGGFRGTLGGESEVPVVAISREDGSKLQELMSGGQVEVAVTVEDVGEMSRNVVAELPGTGDGVVVVGAHYDTVPEVIGANDNASGVGVLLALAGELVGRPFPFTLRFIAFGSEETGLDGSRHYVDQLTDAELGEIRAMVNLDVVGSGNGLRVTGDRWLTNHVSETAAREGAAASISRGIRGGSSDHASFRDAWVPVIFFHADDTSRIHTPEDTMEFINSALLGDTASLVLDLLESLESLPGYAQ